jgi:hypothetical protein
MSVAHSGCDHKTVAPVVTKAEYGYAITLARRVHPVVHDSTMDAARLEGICPKHAHDIITVQQEVHLVSEHVCVAILTKPVSATYNGIGASLESVRRASGHAWTYR